MVIAESRSGRNMRFNKHCLCAIFDFTLDFGFFCAGENIVLSKIFHLEGGKTQSAMEHATMSGLIVICIRATELNYKLCCFAVIKW